MKRITGKTKEATLIEMSNTLDSQIEGKETVTCYNSCVTLICRIHKYNEKVSILGVVSIKDKGNK